MKKVKLFLLSGFLVILTVMSFAFRERFTSYSLWVKYGSSYIELATSGSNPGFSTTGLMPCRVKDDLGNGYSLYGYTGTAYINVYSAGGW